MSEATPTFTRPRSLLCDNAADDGYQGWAKKLQQDCVELVAAAKAKEVDKAKALAGDIAKQCAACHEAYR